MVEPLAVVIASGVAKQATEAIVNEIQESDDPKQGWERAALEVAIQLESYYRQNIENDSKPDPENIKSNFGGYGEMLQEIAIRGEVNGFDEDDVELVRNLAEGCASFTGRIIGPGDDIEKEYNEELADYIEEAKSRFS